MSKYVSTQAELEELVKELEGSKVLAIDTEFLREKTYYAKLCLIQVNNGKTQAIIDPLDIDDLKILAPILVDKNCVKIFHAGSQDIGILYHATGVIPTPLFDTQVAAALLGFPLQVGYGPLVRSMCGVKLEKADGYTDWSRRPLTKSQVKYALDDVVYLPQMYESMTITLKKKGRETWLDEDFKDLSDPSKYVSDPREMWRRVKRVSTLNRMQLSIVREIAAWREKEAMKRNVPRKWVIADEAIVELARKAPKTQERLLEVRGLSGHLSRKSVNSLLECVRIAKDMPQEQWPRLEPRQRGNARVEGVVDLMAAVVEVRAHQNDVASPVLASHDDLVKLAHGHRDESPVLHGWRYEMVGKELVDLLDGRLGIFLKDGIVEVTQLPSV